jgi:hypothetical protein
VACASSPAPSLSPSPSYAHPEAHSFACLSRLSSTSFSKSLLSLLLPLPSLLPFSLDTYIKATMISLEVVISLQFESIYDNKLQHHQSAADAIYNWVLEV